MAGEWYSRIPWITMAACLISVPTPIAGQESADRDETRAERNCIAALDAVKRVSQIDFGVRTEGDGIRTDVSAVIPPSSLSVRSTGGVWKASFKWFVTQRNSSGKRFGEVWAGTVRLTMSQETFESFLQNGYVVHQRIVPTDEASLHVVICDLQSGNVGTRTLPGTRGQTR
jgi:hypothetical protein